MNSHTWSSSDDNLVKVTSSCDIASQRIQGLLEAYFKIKIIVAQESIICVRVALTNLSLLITVCQTEKGHQNRLKVGK